MNHCHSIKAKLKENEKGEEGDSQNDKAKSLNKAVNITATQSVVCRQEPFCFRALFKHLLVFTRNVLHYADVSY